MVLELHVWGPAFSLPSIDAQCIAAIAYLSQAVPRGEWCLIASSDPGLSPTNELPALRNENVWIGGFRNIIDYISKLSGAQWSLDADLEGLDRADCIAYSSFIESRGQDLLDLSLYVSSQNYVVSTRPAYTNLQTFPLPYITPPAIRSAAKSRTAHLGFSALDIDTDENTEHEKSIIPDSLRRPRNTLKGLLSKPENAARIRLDALATAFFTPLQELRGGQRFFITQFLTSTDCLALGYLSLALLPDLPSSWLANCMRQKYPQLCAFVHDLQNSFFGGSVSLTDAGLGVQTENDERARGTRALPWKSPQKGGLLSIAGVFGANVVDSLPIVSQLRQNARLRAELEKEAEDEEDRDAIAELASMDRKELYTTIGTVVAGVGLFIGFMFQQGLISLGSAGEHSQVDERRGLDQYGEAGTALAALVSQMDFQNAIGNQSQQEHNEVPIVEVDVELIPDRMQ